MLKFKLFLLLFIFSFNNSALAISERELQLIDGGIYYYSPSGANLNCATSASFGSGLLPDNIPEPMNTIMTAAAQKHEADPLLLATIYAVENALYHNDAYLSDDWLLQRVHDNDWNTSSGSAQGPFQIVKRDSGNDTWSGIKQEGDFLYEEGKWTIKRGPGDGINILHFDDSAYASSQYIAGIGGKAGLSLGGIEQDFLRDNAQGYDVATVLKNYNAGPATWRNENGVWMKGSQGPWDSRKQTEINNYIEYGLKIYVNLAAGENVGVSSGCGAINVGNINIINIAAEADSKKEFYNRPLMTNPSAIALHWTGGSPDVDGLDFISHIADRPDDDGLCCSVQFFVNGRGEIYQLTDPIHEHTIHIRSWNNAALGIEIAAGSDGTTATAKNEIMSNSIQQEAVAQLVKYLMLAYNIPADSQFGQGCNGNTPTDLSPIGIIGHIDYPCSNNKVDPSAEYVELIRERVR